MGVFLVVVVGGVLLLQVAFLLAIYNSTRSVLALLFGAGNALICSGLAYYSLIESNSVAWAAIYGVSFFPLLAIFFMFPP